MGRLLGLLLILQALILAPVGAQPPASARRTVIDGGRSLWLTCAGAGQPAVILEAGHTESSATWEQLTPRIATFTRVCSYDRAGRGGSDPAPVGPRRGADVVRDLRAVLHVASEPGPYILVGHSLGGAFVRLFAASDPGSVAGLVLVDAVHEREFAAIDGLLTPEQRAAGAGMRPFSPEGIDIDAVFEELAGTARPLSVPLIVIARGQPLAAGEMPPNWTTNQRRRREELRQELQADLATLSLAGELIVAERSGHYIHQEQPEIIVQAIHKLIARWRQSRGGL